VHAPNVWSRYMENWRALRRAVNAVGAELEQWSYEALDRDAEDQPVIHRQVRGTPLYFCVDRWSKAPNGHLTICIDAKGLPTLLGVKPSYQFAKRPDGSVYYP
jgi:hypothetical protein